MAMYEPVAGWRRTYHITKRGGDVWLVVIDQSSREARRHLIIDRDDPVLPERQAALRIADSHEVPIHRRRGMVQQAMDAYLGKDDI